MKLSKQGKRKILDNRYWFSEDFVQDDFEGMVCLTIDQAKGLLEIAKDYLVVLCRTQVIEGEGRYNNIFIDNPPTYVYQYVNRIQCWKDGIRPTGSSSQAYCWLVWDKSKIDQEPVLRWIKRSVNY